MKVLCVSDHVDPLVYSAAVKRRFADVELVLSAGDLPMEYLAFISASLNKPVLFVFGNHHLDYLARFRKWGVGGRDPEYEQPTAPVATNYFGSTYVGSTVVRVRGLLIAGLGGCRRYNRGVNQFTETGMLIRMLTLLPRLWFNRVFRGRFLDIFLTHAPPFGINDQPDLTHSGFRVFLWFLRTFKPRYMLHGHIHLYDINAPRVATYGETAIVNVYDHYVLQIDPPSVEQTRRSP